MLFRIVCALMTLLSACSPGPDNQEVSSLQFDAGNQGNYAVDFRIAVSDKESQSGFYRLGVSTGSALKDGGLRVCPGSREQCLRNEVAAYETSLIRTGDRSVYLSDQALKLSDDLLLTVVGETLSGEQLIGTYQLKAVQPESPCHKAPDEFVCDVEAHIARLTNEYRQRQGRQALVHDQKMSYVSRLWSAEQARTGQISHAWFSNGRWRQEYVREFGEQPRLTAENVAMNSGSGDAETVATRFVNQWINSSGHRANMLGGHKTIGVGVARRGNSWYSTQNFGN